MLRYYKFSIGWNWPKSANVGTDNFKRVIQMGWKDEFLKLYMSTSQSKIENALALKEQNIPSVLYRYRSAKEEKYVVNELRGNIYIPHISELNDPFDSCSLLGSENVNRYFQMEDFKEKVEYVTEKKIPENVLKDDTWSEDIINYFLSLYGVSDDERRKNIESYLADMRGKIENSNIRVNEMIKRNYRIACFSETLYNLPMWNHYANSHQGICLEYDTSKFAYDDAIRKRLFPVFYQNKLPDLLETIKNMDLQNLPITMFDYILIQKMKDWSYEKEWRLVLDFGQIARNAENISEDYWSTGKIEFLTKPSKVYLGAKISRDMRLFIIAVCDKLNIKVSQMECTEYGLKDCRII